MVDVIPHNWEFVDYVPDPAYYDLRLGNGAGLFSKEKISEEKGEKKG